MQSLPNKNLYLHLKNHQCLRVGCSHPEQQQIQGNQNKNAKINRHILDLRK